MSIEVVGFVKSNCFFIKKKTIETRTQVCLPVNRTERHKELSLGIQGLSKIV